MCLPLVAEGEFALVKEHLEVMSDIPEFLWGSLINDNVVNFLQADLAVMQRDERALRRYAPLAAETAERDGHKLFQACAERALGVMHRLAGDAIEADAHLRQALKTFDELETSWQIGRTLAELGELGTVQGDNNLARHYYARAVRAFDAIGAVPDRVRTQAALEGLG